ADDQAFITELRHDAVDDHDKRAGRTADLHTTAAECGDQKSSHDGRVQATLGRHAGGDRERERQRQRHDAHDHAGEQVAHELLARDPFANADDRFRNEQLFRLYRITTEGTEHTETSV